MRGTTQYRAFRSGMLFMLLIGFICMTFHFATQAAETAATLIPIGGGYSDTYEGVIAEALKHAPGDVVHIVVLPTTYSTSAEEITAEERQVNLEDAEARRAQIEEACQAGIPSGKTCKVTLVPVFTRADAMDDANAAYFSADVAAVYVLGGDQTVAMQAIFDTPLEAALATAYQNGALISGTSAGLSMQSRTMIGGYLGDFGPESGLNQGAVDVWNTADKRGLAFGVEGVILEQHFWERARLGRLLNALAQPGAARVGVGVDTYTAAHIIDGHTLSRAFGLYNAAVLDAETFDSAAKASFQNEILSIRSVLFHLLAPGDFSYDLTTRQPSWADVPGKITRTVPALNLPEGSAPLILAGDLTADLAGGQPILTHFIELSGGAGATIMVVATGYPTTDDAAAAITDFGTALKVKTVGLILQPGVTAEIPPAAQGLGGIVLLAPDQAVIQPDFLTPVANAWRSGKPMLLNYAAAAIAGTYYAAQGRTPEATDEQPFADVDYIQRAFLKDQTVIQPGWGLLPVMIEPRLFSDYRWGRLVSLAYAHPDTLALGLPDNAALEITSNGATVLGTNGVVALDMSAASLAYGINNSMVFANALLDVFAPGESVEFTGN